MAVSKRLRYEILRRDNNTCRYCGGRAPDVVLTVDHVTPTALGGSDDPSNLVAACKDCNAGKTSSSPDAPLVADVADKAVLWGAAVGRWNAMRREERYERDLYVDQFTDAWDEWTWGDADKRKPLPKPLDWKATIWQFHETGLPIGDLEDAVQVAGSSTKVTVANTWRYMCGVAWKKVEKMHTGARALLEQDEPDQEEALEETADYQAGVAFMFDHFAYNDLPHRLLAGHIDGRKAYLDRMRWVA
jgi:hypothetical protein